jgi:hypothetical protein
MIDLNCDEPFMEMMEFAQMIKKCEQAHPYKTWDPGA